MVSSTQGKVRHLLPLPSGVSLYSWTNGSVTAELEQDAAPPFHDCSMAVCEQKWAY